MREKLLWTLYGHDDAVVSVAVQPEWDVVVSGSRDGSVMVHSLRHGRYLRSLYRGPATSPARAQIDWVGVSEQGHILTYSRADRTLASYSINGRLLASRAQEDDEVLLAFCFSEGGHVLVVGGSARRVRMLWCHDLKLADTGPREGLTALCVTDGACKVRAAATEQTLVLAWWAGGSCL